MTIIFLRVLLIFAVLCSMSGFSAASDASQVSGYYRAKTPSANKGHGFTVEERDKYGMRGLFPGGTPFTLEHKVAVRYFACALPSRSSY